MERPAAKISLAEIEAAAFILSNKDFDQLEATVREIRAQRTWEDNLARRIGIQPLPRASSGPVTTELVRQLCELLDEEELERCNEYATGRV